MLVKLTALRKRTSSVVSFSSKIKFIVLFNSKIEKPKSDSLLRCETFVPHVGFEAYLSKFCCRFS